MSYKKLLATMEKYPKLKEKFLAAVMNKDNFRKRVIYYIEKELC